MGVKAERVQFAHARTKRHGDRWDCKDRKEEGAANLGELSILLCGLRVSCVPLQKMSTNAPAFVPSEIPGDAKIAIVAARFNAEIVDELLAGCQRRLKGHGIDAARISVHRVPGAFELPVAAKVIAQTRKFAAVICLGCVVRGDTPHFDYVAGEAARGIQRVALDEGLPVIFGVLTTDTEEQARARAGGSHSHAGENAADAALEMIAMIDRVRKT